MTGEAKLVVTIGSKDDKALVSVSTEGDGVNMVQARCIARLTRAVNQEIENMKTETVWIDDKVASKEPTDE